MSSDARVRYTKMMIEKSFVELLKTKPLSEITLKEVCALAEINRSTFYRHYKDIYDWRDQMEAEYQAQIQAIQVRIEEVGFEGALALFLHLLQEKLEIISVLLYRSGEVSSIALLHDIFYYREGSLEEQAADEAEREHLKRLRYYHIFGCCGLIISWIKSRMKESPEEMAHEINVFTQNDRQ